MRASTLILAGSCLLASVFAAPANNAVNAKDVSAQIGHLERGHPHEPVPHHDGDTDCDTDDDGWNTEEDREHDHGHKPHKPEHEHHHSGDDDDTDSDDDDHHHHEHHWPVYPHPEHPPTIPAHPPVCVPSQSIQNPGFEANGGGLSPWKPSNPATVVIDSLNGEPDAQGAHSALVLLNSANTAASLTQHIKVCPHSVYRFYLAIRTPQLNNAATRRTSNGGLRDNAQCTIFVGLQNAGNATIPGASLTPGAYTSFHTGTTFTSDEHVDSKVYLAISCAPSAFNSSQSAANFYVDNVQLLPEPRH